jgi:polar amino acid transport system substrate-binding protein
MKAGALDSGHDRTFTYNKEEQMRIEQWFSVSLAVIVFLVCGPFSGRAGETSTQLARESVIEEIIHRGTLRVGMDIFVPWAMKDKKGELVGFEIDVARRLAEDMGVRIEFVPTRWSGIIPALIAGKFDLIIGGMSVTPKRNLKINFTRPYYFTSQGMLVNKKKTQGFGEADYNSTKVAIAARLGSTAALVAKKNFPRARLRLFDDEPSAVQEVRNGRVHAMIGSQPLPAHMAAEAPELLAVLDRQFMREPIAIGLRKGDVDALNFLNNWIAVIREKGWFDERYHVWFETTAWKKEL